MLSLFLSPLANVAATGIAIRPQCGTTIVCCEDHCVRTVGWVVGCSALLAGKPGAPGFADGTTAYFNNPTGICSSGDATIVADSGNHALRQISATGQVQTLVGNGMPGCAETLFGNREMACFNDPCAVATTCLGVHYVADRGNGRFCQVTLSGSIVAVVTICTTNRPRAVAVVADQGCALADEERGIAHLTPDGGVTAWVKQEHDVCATAMTEKGSLWVVTTQLSGAKLFRKDTVCAQFDLPGCKQIAAGNGCVVAGTARHLFRVTAKQHCASFCVQMSGLLTSPRLAHLADMSFRFDDGSNIRAHRAIVCARSELLHTLIQNNPDRDTFSIPNTDAKAFRVVLQYLYTDTLTIPGLPEARHILLEVLNVAHRIHCQALHDAAVGVCMQQITPATAVWWLLQADRHREWQLRHDTTKYIGCHFFVIQRHHAASLGDLVMNHACMMHVLRAIRPSFST